MYAKSGIGLSVFSLEESFGNNTDSNTLSVWDSSSGQEILFSEAAFRTPPLYVFTPGAYEYSIKEYM